MIRLTTQQRLIPLLLLAAALMQSCVKENTQIEPSTGSQTLVTLFMRVPGNYQPSRTLTQADENQVKTIEVLVFDHTSGQYLYTAYGTQLNPLSSTTTSFTVRLIEGGPVDVVVLANSRKWIGRSYGGEIPKDMVLYKADVQEKLAAEVSGKWNTDSQDDSYDAIPMWGELENITVTAGLSVRDIAMTRMLARIDVLLSAQAKSAFELQSVRLYNYNRKGLLIPDTDALSNQRPSLPADPDKANDTSVGNALLYSRMTTANEALQKEIYAFEAAAGSTADYLNNICLVIGGKYSDGNIYYYRADFANTENYNTTYLPLLRNHSYNVTVSRITGPGYTDPDDAFRSLPANIEVGVLEWDDADMDEMWFDGTYYYSVSPLEIEEWAPETSGQIKVRTDYPLWSFELSDLPTPGDPAANPANIGWFTVTSHTPGDQYTGGGTTDYIKYEIEKNESGGDRTAYIHVTAGRVTMTARIVQNLWFIDRVYVTPTGEIASFGKNRSVVIEGMFADTKVRAFDVTHDTPIGQEGVVPSNANSGDNFSSCALWVPELWHPVYRNQRYDIVVAFEYFSTQHGEWRLIRTEDQPSYWLNISSDLVEGAAIAGSGEVYTIEAWGNFPDVTIRSAAYAGGVYTPLPNSTNAVISGDYKDSSAPSRTTLTVPAADVTRTVYLQYTTDTNQQEWRTLASGSQLRDNHKITYNNRDIYVASDHMRDEDGEILFLTWAEAAGLNTNYDRATYPNYSVVGSENLYITPQVQTGCGAYWEGSEENLVTGKGKWRMPTYYETRLMSQNQHKSMIGGDYSVRTWTSRQESATTAMYFNIEPGSAPTVGQSKTLAGTGVRCVRD